MNNHTEAAETNRRKSLYLDVRGSASNVQAQLQRLCASLDTLDTRNPDGLIDIPLTLALAPPDVIKAKLAELLDPDHMPYRMAEFAESHTGEDSVAIVRAMLPLITDPGITGHIEQNEQINEGLFVAFVPGIGVGFDMGRGYRRSGGIIKFSTIGIVHFGGGGKITAATDRRFLGKDIYHLLACHIDQDLATVMKKGNKFIYTSDISRFEKTPKNDRGHNRFLGRDIVEFHARAPNFGATLGPLFQKIITEFTAGNLDMLVVDLNGQNQFTLENGEQVRRFERDHFIPIKDIKGKCIGFMGIADVNFQPVTETRSPLEGGKIAGYFATQADLTRHEIHLTLRNPISVLEDNHASDEDRIAAVRAILTNKDRFKDQLIARAAELNERRFGRELEVYGISYIADACANDCTYCGLNATRKFKRTSLTDEEMAQDFEAVLQHHPHEFCILAGEFPGLLDKVQRALRILNDVNARNGNRLERITLNTAPLSVENFAKLVQANTGRIPLQYRLFQESYDREQYEHYHTKGPKRDFDFRIGAQERALEAGFDCVGVGALLGLNTDNQPHKHAGHDSEIISLIEHALQIKRAHGKAPSSLSIPRHQGVAGYEFATPNAVDDELYVMYHALLRLALPETKIIITSRETPELIRRVEPFINIRDLAPRPGVGGNIRPDVNFQNELGDARNAEEILRDLRERSMLKIRTIYDDIDMVGACITQDDVDFDISSMETVRIK